MPRVTIDNRIVIAEVGTTLSRLLPGLEQPCSGKGICGKCKVRAEGALSPLTPQEQRHLTVFDLADGLRLACCATVQGDCCVERLDAPPAAVVTHSAAGEGAPHPAFSRCGAAVDVGTTTLAARLYAPDGSLLAEGGVFLCSGIIDTRAEEVAEKLRANGLQITDTHTNDGWYAFTCR